MGSIIDCPGMLSIETRSIKEAVNITLGINFSELKKEIEVSLWQQQLLHSSLLSIHVCR